MKRLAIVVALAAMTGCATVEPVPESPVQQVQQQPVTSLADLNYSSIQVYEKAVEIERAISQQSQHLTMDGNTSPVAAWKLPDYGVHKFKLESFIARTHFGNSANAFMPEIWLLDEQFNILKKRSSERLVYDKQSMMSRETFSEEFIIDNRKHSGQKPVYLVALTTEEARKKTIMVANFDKEYAKVRGKAAPPTPDVYATAASEGTLRLRITPLVSYARAPQSNVAAPASDYVPAVPAVVKKEKLQQLQITTADFLSQVKQAITDGDIGNAMALRADIRNTHSELQTLFQSSYGKTTEELNRIEQSYMKGDKSSDIESQYKAALVNELKKGNAQGALAFIDQAETLSWQVDNLF